MIILPAIILSSTIQRPATITIPDSGMGYLTETTAHPQSVRMAHDGDKIAVVYSELHAPERSLYFSYSSDAGHTFTRPIKLVTGLTVALHPRQFHIAMGGGSIWVSYRRGDKLYLVESAGGAFSKEVQIGSGLINSGDDMSYDARNQFIGYADHGLVVAYPVAATKNVLVGRIEANAIHTYAKPDALFVKALKPYTFPTTPLLKNAFSVGTVRVYPNGSTVRVLTSKNIDPILVVGMSLSNDAGRTWEVLRNDIAEKDNHVTYLGYQETGEGSRFKAIGSLTLAGEYELTVAPNGREWVAIKGDNHTWGAYAWQIVTSDDLTKGLFRGTGMVLTNWYESVNLRGRPEPRTGETIAEVQRCKPSIIASRGISEVFWNQGYLMSRFPGTAWQTSFLDTELRSSYMGVSTPVWRTYRTPGWSNAEAYRRTTSIWPVYFNEMRSYATGPEVVHVGIKKHPTRAGASQTVFKARVTSEFAPLNPDEDSGALDWLDEATFGSNGLLVWLSNNRICLRRVP